MNIFLQAIEVVEYAECSHQAELLQEESERKIEQARVLYDIADRLIKEAREDESRIAMLVKSLPTALPAVDYDAPGMKKNSVNK